MRRARHQQLKDPAAPATASLPEVDPALRDEPDGDPLVEEMVERLRTHLSGLVALDEWGRPVAWRSVVRLAAGPTLARLRDLETSVALAERVIQLPDDEPARSSSTGTGAVAGGSMLGRGQEHA